MPFCSFGTDYVKDNYTQVDNLFLVSYLPSADAVDVKVYLYTIFVAGQPHNQDNDISRIAQVLHLSETRVLEAYKYWQEMGLITLSSTHPLTITIRSVKAPMTPIIKYNASQYADFVEEVARIFPTRVLTSNELNLYFEFLTQTKMESNALLLTMKYIIDLKGGDASVAYILAIANDWVNRGLRTETVINDHIFELENNNSDIRSILSALGVKTTAGIDERQMYIKWTKDWQYNLDAILVAAKMCKKHGGVEKLDKVLTELYHIGAKTAVAISDFARAKKEKLDLAIEIVRSLGGFYASLDIVVETYIEPWLSYGIESVALVQIAKYCFIRGIKSLEGMSTIVEKFFKLALLTKNSIEQYINQQVGIDKKIKVILSAANNSSFVGERERDFYRTWIQDWGFDDDVVLLVAEYSSDKPFPLSYINKILSRLKSDNIYGAIDVMASLEKYGKSKKPREQDNYIKQDYTAEELNSVFRDIDVKDI